MRDKPRVLVTFDSMRYPNTGLYYFGKSLSSALSQRNTDYKFSFYTHKAIPTGLFPSKIERIEKSLLHKVIFPYRFDLVHFTDQYCRPDPYLVRGKKLLTIHDLNPIYELRDKKKKLDGYIKRMRTYINACDHIVAISNFVASDIMKNFPEASGKLSVIHNAADKLVSFNNQYSPLEIPQRPFLFTIGHVSAKKNFHVLPALLTDNNYELIIAGIVNQDYKQLILSEAKKYNCEDRVKIIGTISDADKAWYYENCLAFVFPSLAEGFGLPVVEAMHFGKPVFLSKFTSLPEVGGDQAFYFEEFEANHMRNVLEKGLKHYTGYKDFKDSVIKKAASFSWDKTAESYLELYARLLKDR